MAIFVLGMHRSGTSALTALISSMGAYVGAPADLLPASPGNPEGYFERNDVLAANRTIMQHHGCNWYEVSNYDHPAPPMPASFGAHLRNIIGRLDDHTPFALKDPRFCFTLPYWLRHVESPVVVLSLRHPAAIAHSLRTRNQMPPAQGLALWEAYIGHALTNIEGLPVVRVMYEELCAAPSTQANLLYAQLSAFFPGLTPPDTSIIKPELTHAQTGGIRLTDAQQALFDRALGR